MGALAMGQHRDHARWQRTAVDGVLHRIRRRHERATVQPAHQLPRHAHPALRLRAPWQERARARLHVRRDDGYTARAAGLSTGRWNHRPLPRGAGLAVVAVGGVPAAWSADRALWSAPSGTRTLTQSGERKCGQLREPTADNCANLQREIWP